MCEDTKMYPPISIEVLPTSNMAVQGDRCAGGYQCIPGRTSLVDWPTGCGECKRVTTVTHSKTSAPWVKFRKYIWFWGEQKIRSVFYNGCLWEMNDFGKLGEGICPQKDIAEIYFITGRSDLYLSSSVSFGDKCLLYLFTPQNHRHPLWKTERFFWSQNHRYFLNITEGVVMHLTVLSEHIFWTRFNGEHCDNVKDALLNPVILLCFSSLDKYLQEIDLGNRSKGTL